MHPYAPLRMALCILGWTFTEQPISAAVPDSSGKLVMESILETRAATILQFIHGLRRMWPANTALGCYALGTLTEPFSDGLPLLIHGAVRFRQRKGRNLDIKLLGGLIDHLVGAMH